MRILVTGRNGQVARSLAERVGPSHELIFADRPDFDLADPGTVTHSVARIRPDIVFSVAAYTAVDMAENERDLAMAVNAEGPAALGRAAALVGAPILHLSTDYVFDGWSTRAYREEDPVAPLGIYGKTKLAGEQAIAASGAQYAILRTAWVYSPFGSNFVKTMLRLAADHDEIMVVEDQYGCPTSALDIADAMLRVTDVWASDRDKDGEEIYHFAGHGETNWAEFARSIMAFSAAHGGPASSIKGIPSGAYPTLAQRPANSRLDSRRFATVFGFRAPEWRRSLEATVTRLIRPYSTGLL